MLYCLYGLPQALQDRLLFEPSGKNSCTLAHPRIGLYHVAFCHRKLLKTKAPLLFAAAIGSVSMSLIGFFLYINPIVWSLETRMQIIY